MTVLIAFWLHLLSHRPRLCSRWCWRSILITLWQSCWSTSHRTRCSRRAVPEMKFIEQTSTRIHISKLTESAKVSARSYTEQDSVHCWVVVECCLALEAVAFVVVALRYVTSILKQHEASKLFFDWKKIKFLTVRIVRLSFATILHCVIQSWCWLMVNRLIGLQLTIVRCNVVKSSVKFN